MYDDIAYWLPLSCKWGGGGGGGGEKGRGGGGGGRERERGSKYLVALLTIFSHICVSN